MSQNVTVRTVNYRLQDENGKNIGFVTSDETPMLFEQFIYELERGAVFTLQNPRESASFNLGNMGRQSTSERLRQ